MECIGHGIRGRYRDLLCASDQQIIHDSGWVPNTIVEGCRILLAGFMKSGPSVGIQFLAVGAGQESWDATGAPAPPETATTLDTPYAESIPTERLEVVYLDAHDEASAQPTSRLQITATLPPGYPAPIPPLSTYPLREFGLFGSFDSTPFMINSIRHPVIQKDASATLIRVVRLYF